MDHEQMSSDDLSELARRIRLHALDMTHKGRSSHIGSVLSMADIISVLYGAVLNIDPSNPSWHKRDRFILSKGHAGAGAYAALAERGFFSVEKLQTHYQDGSDLSGHVSHKGIPGVEFSTGSLGHGLPVATGFAFAAKMRRATNRVFALLSDGECDEGANWEAILFAPHHRLTNLIVVVDYNQLQSIKTTHETLNLEPFADKWRAFGWDVVEVDGHNHQDLKHALDCSPAELSAPRCVIARTIKGKGVSFMENSVLWHYRSPQGQEYYDAIAELKRD